MIEYTFKNEMSCDGINITSSKPDNDYIDLFIQSESNYPKEEVNLVCIENTENNHVGLGSLARKIVFLRPDEINDNHCITTKKMTLVACNINRDFSNSLTFGFYYHFKGSGKDYSEASILLASEEDILGNFIGEDFIIEIL